LMCDTMWRFAEKDIFPDRIELCCHKEMIDFFSFFLSSFTFLFSALKIVC
jgi:hypothetical protein